MTLMASFLFSGKQALTDCIDCTAGYYCLEAGNDTVTGQCMAGYYCTLAAKDPNPTGKCHFQKAE